MEVLKQRMYGLVPYNISSIQKGIQFGHAVVDYSLTQNHDDISSIYNQWAHYDKTFIILNGGTTNTQTNRYGTLNKHLETLFEMGITISAFYEPDLGDQLTAVVFLVDERVWDKEKYPDYGSFNHNLPDKEQYPEFHYKELFGRDSTWILELREFLSQFKSA